LLIDVPAFPALPHVTQAGSSASSSYFSSSVTASSVFWYPVGAQAVSETVLEFAPTTSGMASIGLSASSFCLWTEGAVNLVNAATGQTVFSYSWDCIQPQTLGGPTWLAPALLNVALSATERYILTLHTAANSHHEGTLNAGITVSGLHVPEPGLASLLALGTAFAIHRRRRAGGRPAESRPGASVTN
jgi:hypothetical protein